MVGGHYIEAWTFQPFSSTPFRPSPTFHEELLECSIMSPACHQQNSHSSSGDSMETAGQSMNEFSKVLAEAVSTWGKVLVHVAAVH